MHKLFSLLFTFLLSSCAINNHPSNKVTSYGALLKNFDYPFKVQNFNFSSQRQNLKMAYMDLNSKSDKTVVLLHGKNFSGYYWKDIANELVQRGFRVIIPDQIGFGKSSKPSSYQHSFGQFSHNTHKLLNHLGISTYNLVGHSMGGMLAVTMAYLRPRRVSQLILLNPIGLENYLNFTKFKDPEFFFAKEIGKTPAKVRAYQKKNYYDGKWEPKYEALLIPSIGQIKGADWPLIAWNNALTYGPIFSENITARIKKLVVPTTFILGTRDRTGPGRGWKREGLRYKLGQYHRFPKALKKLLPSAKVIELEGLGHMPHFEDPTRFSKYFYPLFK